MKCLICLENIQASFTILICDCNQSYHIECINTWLNNRNNCPICNITFNRINKQNNKLHTLQQAIFFDSINKFYKFKYT